MRKFWNNQKGVTMIEVLVTIAILAIVVTPCLSAFVMAQRGNVKAAETQQAYTAAANLMEELKGLSGDDWETQVQQRMDYEYEVDGVKLNQNDGIHVKYDKDENGAYYTIWIYVGETGNESIEPGETAPDGYILKGVIAP